MNMASWLMQGIGHMYFMVDFICMGLVNLPGSLSKRITKLEVLVQTGIRTHAQHEPQIEMQTFFFHMIS